MLFRCMLFFDKKNSYHPYNYPKFKWVWMLLHAPRGRAKMKTVQGLKNLV